MPSEDHGKRPLSEKERRQALLSRDEIEADIESDRQTVEQFQRLHPDSVR